MNSEHAAYEARFGWTARTVLMTLIGLAFFGCAFLPNAPLLMAVSVGAFGLVGLLTFSVGALSRKVALRVDENGVTLGGSPLPVGYKTDVVPWTDIISVVLWTQHVGRKKMPYIGLQRKQGSPQLPGQPYGPHRQRMYETLIPHVSPEIVHASRPVNLWNLDRARLESAVETFAPQVEVVDISHR
ncbi:hypothetical protein [Streptomyces rhizosphaerihabitans]|uniref:hypothetical protein n=1 Tax=Streptomyces rhizosphaerihabitans TaxID=1266770 RepID=UPI0021C0A54B|nr:hypothetical protein [Streptomyces rhizosphaerihabitans]MCT9007377.1 hypothetical protein [Streptomyces rhizosphaerihabitans]